LQEKYKKKYSGVGVYVDYKVTRIQYYQGKYPYIDIIETSKFKQEKSKRKFLYTSYRIRVFIVNEVFYYIIIENNEICTMKSICRSRKAVHRDFKRLVNNVTIIEAEEAASDD
jgi:hypothetical protein